MPTLDNYQNVMGALTIWREARGQTIQEQRAVLHVILNRVKDRRWPDTISQVVTQPEQFSSFNAGDPNAVKWPSPKDPIFMRCCSIMDEPGIDPTLGANHYHSPMEHLPHWADQDKVTVRIGAFTFYRL
jgi:cell wall hydrolase